VLNHPELHGWILTHEQPYEFWKHAVLREGTPPHTHQWHSDAWLMKFKLILI
jgi:hypothetical protein